MQEVWNRTNGELFDLNEYGDFTTQEFEQVQKRPHTVYWEDDNVRDSPAHAPSKTPRFKQVMTFCGGFRMVQMDDNGNPVTADAIVDTVDPSSSKPTVVSSPPLPRQRQLELPRRKRGGFWRTGLLGDPAIR
jgi:hypothetical protein